MQELAVAGRPRVVQYVRMSTEHQRYSLDNQRNQLAEYASQRGYDIVDTYADSGRSGLTLKERGELNRLLRDVTDPNRTFSAILVLDVSRWGRFQDPDQHAFYEFLCRDMGVRVEYVAESFENDGTFAASIMKHMKRVMAGEYSRELSAKVSYCQVRSAWRGHKQGGTLTYGLRRLLVGADGVPKHELADGDRKALADDRVVIVLGAPQEQETVRHIFDLFLKGATLSGISRHLNFLDTPSTRSSPWTPQKVKYVLANELYTGIYVFNRWSQKLRGPRVENPPGQWVRISVCDGMIDREIFDRVAVKLASPRRGKCNNYSTAKMLGGLERLLSEKGRLTIDLINACPYVPHISTYYKRIGAIKEIYALLGYEPTSPLRIKVVRPHRRKPYTKDELIAHLQRVLAEHGYLSKRVVEQCSYTAAFSTYFEAFGSVSAAYEAAGYDPLRRGPGKNGKFDKSAALRKLKGLFDHLGYVNASVVTGQKSMPSAVWYRRTFGSFTQACAAAGIEPDYPVTAIAGRFRVLRDYLDGPEGGDAPIRGKIDQLPDEDLFRTVRRIFEQNGYISRDLMRTDPDMPSIYFISKRYASITHLYAAAGLPSFAVERDGRINKRVRVPAGN